MAKQPTEAQQRATLKRLDRFSRLMDSSIGLPFTRFKFGVEAVIGLVPVVGDFVGLVLSSYVLIEAHRVGASKAVKRRMRRNMMIDFLGGLIPVVGDAFDAIYKANTRNTGLLRTYLEQQLAVEPSPPPFPWKVLIGLSVFIGVLAGWIAFIW